MKVFVLGALGPGAVTNNPVVVTQVMDAAVQAGDTQVIQDPAMWKVHAQAQAELHQHSKPVVAAAPKSQAVVGVAGGGFRSGRQPVRSQPLFVVHGKGG